MSLSPLRQTDLAERVKDFDDAVSSNTNNRNVSPGRNGAHNFSRKQFVLINIEEVFLVLYGAKGKLCRDNFLLMSSVILSFFRLY